jgi:hypothetical protein
VLLAASVSTLEVVDDVGLNEAVTPLGSPDTVKATLPVNPPVSATVMVSVPLAPCVTLKDDADRLRLNPGVAVALTVSVKLVLAVMVPEVPVTVTV